LKDQACADRLADFRTPGRDRLGSAEFVLTIFSMGENEIYLKDERVEDPLARVCFPKAVAVATLEWEGNKFYLIGEETRREFSEKNKIAIN
jgi:hypothetical protein